jgi:hypothetical protein
MSASSSTSSHAGSRAAGSATGGRAPPTANVLAPPATGVWVGERRRVRASPGSSAMDTRFGTSGAETRETEGDGRRRESRNRSGAAPSLKFRGTERAHILGEYSPGSRSAPTAPHPNRRGSGAAPLHSRGSPTKHTVSSSCGSHAITSRLS